MSSADGRARPAAPRGNDGGRLRLDPNPLRLAWSAVPWRAAGYLACYLAISWALFSVALTAVTAAAALAITLAGIPLLVAAAALVRGCASVERRLLRQVFTGPVSGGYRQADTRGILAQAATSWRDPATWRALAYLIGLWVPLYVLDTIVLSVWLTLLAGITLPAWYWAPRGTGMLGYVSGENHVHGVPIGVFPHGVSGPGAVGFYADTLPKALLAAAAFLALFLLFNYVLVITARAHARIARSLLRAPVDPLAEAKQVLCAPGPLGPLKTQLHNGALRAGHQP